MKAGAAPGGHLAKVLRDSNPAVLGQAQHLSKNQLWPCWGPVNELMPAGMAWDTWPSQTQRCRCKPSPHARRPCAAVGSRLAQRAGSAP